MAKNWYVVHTYSGFEKFVAETVRQKATELSLDDQIGQIIIPTEGVVEIKGGKKVVSTKRSYPGYILIEMEMSDENWHIIRETPKVTGFVGSSNRPPQSREIQVRASRVFVVILSSSSISASARRIAVLTLPGTVT